ncbi:efflux RND transporter periplasmic adaptor subunit [Sphingobium boeckii]|uniref:HlyD family secretion protein n=1 Tax=Sphingobium boeckii TaxID=1082345 RepID=A0A7W9EEV3_9SPHN|nr:efflux RND transporter periplasmic adaptor subunit [Sphingobium boeckii]MBB5685056.1 HlyD family secretion protein [Sphingobium boeckii]
MTEDTTPPATDLDDFLGVKPQKPWRKWAVRGGIALSLIIILLLLARCFGGSEEPNYSTREVRRGDLTVTVSATGNLKPVNQVDVGSEQSGKITQVYVDVNDRVTKGQKLAELDIRRLLDTITQNQAQVASADAGVAQAEAGAALARATLERQESVFKISGGRVPSKTELDSARANYRQALAAVRSAQAQTQVSRAQLSTAQTNLSIAQIVSPVTGVVLSRDIEPGQTVAASFNAPVLFTIAEDLTQMEVEVSVDEADVGQVKDGQSATFTVDAFPGRSFPAMVTRVNVGSNAASSASTTTTTSTTGTVVAYTAVLSLDNADEMLRPGMTATASIVTKQLANALLVPNAALRFTPSQGSAKSGGITSSLMGPPRRGNRATREVSFGAGSRQTVYVMGEDGKPQAVEVTVGDSDGSRTAITGGDLKEGMKVITGQLAAGQSAPAEDQADTAGDKRGQGKPPAGNGMAPAAPSPAGNAAAVAPGRSAAENAQAADKERMNGMTPDQRRAYFDSLPPAQKAEMQKQGARASSGAAAANAE